MGILEHIDILGGAFCRSELGQHHRQKVDEVDCAEAAAIFIQVVDKIGGSDVIIKGLHVLEVFVLHLINGGTDEFDDGTLGCLEGGTISKFGHVDDGLGMGMQDVCGGSIDGIFVEEGALGSGKEDGVFCLVFVTLHNYTNKIVLSIGIIWDAEWEGREDLSDGSEVIISGVAREGHETCRGFGKEGGD